MKLILLLIVVAESVLGEYSSNRPDQSKKFLMGCAHKTGVSMDDLRALHEKSADWPLPDNQQNFICCITKPLVSFEKVNTRRIQVMIDERFPGNRINLMSAIDECGSTGIDPNSLASCYQTATFFRCLFFKLHKLTEESDIAKIFT